MRRRRATTLLYASTTQNVVWAITREWIPKPTWKSIGPRSIRRLNVFCSATAVTMPGSAIGSTIRKEIEERPKKR